VAALATQEASPEQSVPRGESPPVTYGVPETWLTIVINVAVAISIMSADASNGICSLPKFVAAITFRRNDGADNKYLERVAFSRVIAVNHTGNVVAASISSSNLSFSRKCLLRNGFNRDTHNVTPVHGRNRMLSTRLVGSLPRFTKVNR
jgi:hypothetical protein